MKKTFIMGIVNVTPDSFSDGLLFYEANAAISYGEELFKDGADIIDVGGVSTAPHRKAVSVKEELRRVLPVISGLKKAGVKLISVDTKQSLVADAALSAGASWINDQSGGLFDRAMPVVMAKADGVIIMHDGAGVTSGVDAGEGVYYDDIIRTLREFFKARVKELHDAGVDPKKIIVDPGIGFGKGLKDSLTIINNMNQFRDVGTRTLIGVSRKSFLGKITGIVKATERDAATRGAEAMAILAGADIVRTHQVKAAREMALVLDSYLSEKSKSS